jgi:hypothetical protein
VWWSETGLPRPDLIRTQQKRREKKEGKKEKEKKRRKKGRKELLSGPNKQQDVGISLRAVGPGFDSWGLRAFVGHNKNHQPNCGGSAEASPSQTGSDWCHGDNVDASPAIRDTHICLTIMHGLLV